MLFCFLSSSSSPSGALYTFPVLQVLKTSSVAIMNTYIMQLSATLLLLQVKDTVLVYLSRVQGRLSQRWWHEICCTFACAGQILIGMLVADQRQCSASPVICHIAQI